MPPRSTTAGDPAPAWPWEGPSAVGARSACTPSWPPSWRRSSSAAATCCTSDAAEGPATEGLATEGLAAEGLATEGRTLAGGASRVRRPLLCAGHPEVDAQRTRPPQHPHEKGVPSPWRGALSRAAHPAAAPRCRAPLPRPAAAPRCPGGEPRIRPQRRPRASGGQGGHHAGQVLGEVVAPQIPLVGGTRDDLEVMIDAGVAERPGKTPQVGMDGVLDDVGADLLELGLQRRPDVGVVLKAVEEVEPGTVAGAQEDPLVAVGAHVVERVVAFGDLGIEVCAPRGAGQVAGAPVLLGIEAGAGPDRPGDEIGRAHVCTPLTWPTRMPPPA